jgi:hypothetical protein
MLAKILSSVAIKLMTEKVIIKVTLTLAEWLAKRTTNTLDDELIKQVKEALK